MAKRLGCETSRSKTSGGEKSLSKISGAKCPGPKYQGAKRPGSKRQGMKRSGPNIPGGETIWSETFRSETSWSRNYGGETSRSKRSGPKFPGPKCQEAKHPGPKRKGAKRPGPKCQAVKFPGPKCQGAKRPGPKCLDAKTLPVPSLHYCETSCMIVTLDEASLWLWGSVFIIWFMTRLLVWLNSEHDTVDQKLLFRNDILTTINFIYKLPIPWPWLSGHGWVGGGTDINFGPIPIIRPFMNPIHPWVLEITRCSILRCPKALRTALHGSSYSSI